MERLTVLYFDSQSIDNPGRSGTSDTLWQMAHHMANLGHRAIIAGFYRSTDYPYSNVEVRIIRQPRILERNIVTFLLSAVVARRAIKQMDDIQLVHIRDYLYGGVFLQLGKFLPLVMATPGNPYEREENGVFYFDPLSQTLYKWAARLMARRANRIIALSKEQRDWWLYTGTSPLRMAQISLGIDEELFHPIPDARTQLGLEEDAKIILFTGRLHTNIKGLDLLLPAFEKAVQAVPKLELHLAGDGPDRGDLERWVAEHGLTKNVRFLGYTKPQELALRYSAADMTVLTSRSESFPRVVVESMACGTPVIGTPHGGVLDVIRDGENGFIVDPNCTDKLANAMILLARDQALREKIGAKALTHVRESLTWPSVMKRLISEVYEPIIQGK